MSEVVSFGNIVNSLRAVRNDYNEHLKAVPQYEAFLLVESSTQSVADKLQDVSPAMAAEVVEALETAKAKFRQHLTSVPEYRALLAIDKLINDVAADLGVQAVAAAPAQTKVEAVTETTSAPTEVEQPIADQQTVARAETTEPLQFQLEEVAHGGVVAETVASLPTTAEAEVQQAETQPELTTADVLSQVQSALQTTETPDVTTVAEAASRPSELTTPLPEPTLGTQPTSHAPLQTEFGQEAEKAA